MSKLLCGGQWWLPLCGELPKLASTFNSVSTFWRQNTNTANCRAPISNEAQILPLRYYDGFMLSLSLPIVQLEAYRRSGISVSCPTGPLFARWIFSHISWAFLIILSLSFDDFLVCLRGYIQYSIVKVLVVLKVRSDLTKMVRGVRNLRIGVDVGA